MNLPQKRPRIKLDSGAYAFLKSQVLERDSWRCQECGYLENLQIHHLKFRSSLGDDTMTNLITRYVLLATPGGMEDSGPSSPPRTVPRCSAVVVSANSVLPSMRRFLPDDLVENQFWRIK
jgi:hypothetical protein